MLQQEELFKDELNEKPELKVIYNLVDGACTDFSINCNKFAMNCF